MLSLVVYCISTKIMGSFLVIAKCPHEAHSDHLVGILPRESRRCTLCMNKSNDRDIFCIKHYINLDYHYCLVFLNSKICVSSIVVEYLQSVVYNP